MPGSSSTSNNTAPRRQKAAERTNIALLRYILDHPTATCRAAAEDLGMSFPNVCRLVAEFKASGILLDGEQQQTGKRGPWSRAVMLRGDLGCSIGVDLEATRVRGVILDFANNVIEVLRHPISPADTPAQIVSTVAKVAADLTRSAAGHGIRAYIVGLGLPGPVVDRSLGKVRTDLQFGEGTLEFVAPVERACGVRTSAAANSYCFAAGHHRMHNPRGLGIEMVVLNRFGLAAALVWNGQLYTGASDYAGDLGLLPCSTTYRARRLKEVCTGASLLRYAQARGDGRPFQELLALPDDPVVSEWVREAAPAFAQAIYSAIMAYNPDRVLIEGIFNKLPAGVRDRIVSIVREDVVRTGNMLPEIRFFEGDDLMGARGGALLARDQVADEALAEIIAADRLCS